MDLSIGDDDFCALRQRMYEATGVWLTEAKKTLIVGRLRKRMMDLGLKNFKDYITLLRQPEEMEVFINAITTNETYFFRHSRQFTFLTQTALPSLFERKRDRGQKEIRIWSAACSTGEEPYSIAITCKEFFKIYPGWRFPIFASDINSKVLEQCRKAVYLERSLHHMPKILKERYFTPIEDNASGGQKKYQLDRDIARLVRFSQHNLLRISPHKNMDIIFLRNVMIYFNKQSKQKVIHLIEQSLGDGGYFFISLSESLFDVNTDLTSIEPGIFQKK